MRSKYGFPEFEAIIGQWCQVCGVEITPKEDGFCPQHEKLRAASGMIAKAVSDTQTSMSTLELRKREEEC